jgi:hypothetical protein
LKKGREVKRGEECLPDEGYANVFDEKISNPLFFAEII